MSHIDTTSKETCDCGKVATWLYMPGYGDGSNPFSCDDCVPRGCDCNHHYVSVDAYHPPLDKPDLPNPDEVEGVDWKWLEKDKVWCYLDPDNGLEYPCCEYEHDYEGFEKDEEDNV